MRIDASDIDEAWLPDMYEWLSDPFTNRMTRAGTVTLEGQRRWFESLPERTDYWIQGLVIDGERAGAFGLKRISPYAGEVFCYVGRADRRGGGAGAWMLRECEREAQRRQLARLWGLVVADNTASRRMFHSSGYVSVGQHGEWGICVEKLVAGREITAPI